MCRRFLTKNSSAMSSDSFHVLFSNLIIIYHSMISSLLMLLVQFAYEVASKELKIEVLVPNSMFKSVFKGDSFGKWFHQECSIQCTVGRWSKLWKICLAEGRFLGQFLVWAFPLLLTVSLPLSFLILLPLYVCHEKNHTFPWPWLSAMSPV